MEDVEVVEVEDVEVDEVELVEVDGISDDEREPPRTGIITGHDFLLLLFL